MLKVKKLLMQIVSNRYVMGHDKCSPDGCNSPMLAILALDEIRGQEASDRLDALSQAGHDEIRLEEAAGDVIKLIQEEHPDLESTQEIQALMGSLEAYALRSDPTPKA